MNLSVQFIISVLVFHVTMVTVSRGYSYTGERSIRTSVLSSFAYDRMSRPNASTTAVVGYNILVVKNLDLSQQSLTCTGWYTLLWHDERLMWNPGVYDNTEYIHALEEEIWKPEILINNAVENVGLVSDDHLIYRIKYTGEVEWEPLVSSTVDCGIDVTYFPFDTQECNIELTSWGLPDTELNLTPLWDSINLDEYRESEVWTILTTDVSKSRVKETLHGSPEYYSKIIFTIRMSRKPGNYVFNTLLPIIVSSFQMAITNLIPLRTGERLVSGYLVLVINTLLLTIFLQQIPDIATTTAILGIYLIGSLCLDYIIMIINTLLARLFHKSACQKPVGWCVGKITLFLKKLLCFHDKVIKDDRESLITIPTDDLKKIEKNGSIKRNSVDPESGSDLDISGFTETLKVKETSLPAITAKYDLDISNVKLRKNERRKKEMRDYILHQSNPENEITWEIVASVFDRLCFLVYFIIKIAYNIVLIGNLFYQRRSGSVQI